MKIQLGEILMGVSFNHFGRGANKVGIITKLTGAPFVGVSGTYTIVGNETHTVHGCVSRMGAFVQ